jgi:hypothetical protein
MADTHPVEIVGNFHLHTTCSDGSGTHLQVAEAAARAGLDVLVFTDHNVWVDGQEGWYTHPETGREVLLLMGEEVHDPALRPKANHYLCLGADRDVSEYGPRPQALVDAVKQHGGVGFIAHPVDPAAMLFDEPALPWMDWEVTGFAGIELWNYMSELKTYLTSWPAALFAVFFPGMCIAGPFPETLSLWDRLLSNGQKVAAVGCADAHAHVYHLGPLTRAVFPYEYLFRAVNTHMLLAGPLARDVATAKAQVLEALRAGHAFVGYDLAGEGRGFRFTATGGATGKQETVSMGDEIALDAQPALRVSSPLPAELRLLRDGREVARARGRELTYPAGQPGVYRVEVTRRYRLKQRGWIFSNPIYVRG